MSKPRGALLIYVLVTVMALFIGILIFVWVAAKRANPVMLDENGRPIAMLAHTASCSGV
jgi:uncharacterized protein YneF (UPF0154 family)